MSVIKINGCKLVILAMAFNGMHAFADLAAENVYENEYAALEKEAGLLPISSGVVIDTGFEITGGAESDKVVLKLAPKGNTRYSFSLSAPLKDKATSANLYSSETDAFADAATISFNYKFNTISGVEAFFNQDTESLNEACEADPAKFDITSGMPEDCFNETIEDKLAAYQKNTGKAFFSNARLELEDLAFYTWGFTATYGRQEYDHFIDGMATMLNDDGELQLATDDPTKNPWGFSVFWQYLVPNKGSFYVEAGYQEGYDAQSEEVRCLLPDEDAEIISGCLSRQAGAPTSNDNINLTFGLRNTLPLIDRPFAFEATYDFKDDGKSASLPIYLFKDAKSNWTAGVRWDYDSGESGSVYSFFIGSTFNFYKN